MQSVGRECLSAIRILPVSAAESFTPIPSSKLTYLTYILAVEPWVTLCDICNSTVELKSEISDRVI